MHTGITFPYNISNTVDSVSSSGSF